MKRILSVLVALLLAWPLTSLADKNISTEDRIQQIYQELSRIDAICIPPKGTPRNEVEKKFGVGKPGVNHKSAPDGVIPEDSPFRLYEFCPNGTLFVNYGDAWNLAHAYFIDPHSVKGRLSP